MLFFHGLPGKLGVPINRTVLLGREAGIFLEMRTEGAGVLVATVECNGGDCQICVCQKVDGYMEAVFKNIFFWRNTEFAHKKPVQISSVYPHIVGQSLNADAFVVIVFDKGNGLFQVAVFAGGDSLSLGAGQIAEHHKEAAKKLILIFGGIPHSFNDTGKILYESIACRIADIGRLGKKTAILEDGLDIGTVKADPDIFPGIVRISRIIGGNIWLDQEGLVFSQKIGFIIHGKASLSFQNEV